MKQPPYHLVGLLLLLPGLIPADASAQDLYGVRGDATLEFALETNRNISGFDDTGAAWELYEGQARCTTPDGETEKFSYRTYGEDSLVPAGVPGNGYGIAAVGPDGLYVLGIRRNFASPHTFSWGNVDAIQFGRISCADVIAGNPWTSLGFATFLGTPKLGFNSSGTVWEMHIAPDGRFCFRATDGLRCLTPGDGELQHELTVPAADFDTAIDYDPGLVFEMGSVPLAEPAERQWRLRVPRWIAGELWFIAEVRFLMPHSTGTAVSDWFGYLVQRTDEGLVVHVTPTAPRTWGGGSSAVSPLGDVTDLRYRAEFDAIVGYPVRSIDTRQAGNTATRDGIGLLVSPLSGEPPVILSLSIPAAKTFWCGMTACGPGLGCPDGSRPYCADYDGMPGALSLPDGSMGILMARGDPVVNPTYGLYRLTFDPQTYDLDYDGLTGAQEAVLGTSDFMANSDRRLMPDGLEVLYGTDPADPEDDLSTTAPGQLYYASSGLIRRILPSGVDWRSGAVRGTGIEGPLCLHDRCILEDRTTEVPVSVDGTARKSVDGRWLIHNGRFIDPYTGEDAGPLPDSDAYTLVVNNQLVWTASDPEAPGGFTVRVSDADGTRVVYDHEKARCDSGLGPCDPAPVLGLEGEAAEFVPGHDVSPSQVAVGGWLPDAERLMLSVSGTWSRYVVLLHATEPPVVYEYGARVFHGAKLDLMPRWVQPTGHDDVLVGMSNGSGSNIRLLDGYGTPRPLTAVDGLMASRMPAGFWGDVLVEADATTGAPWELVRYEGSAVDRGDVLLAFYPTGQPLDAPDSGSLLFRSGPRGGLAPVWPEPVYFDNIWGLDVNAAGWACVADRKLGVVQILAPAAGTFTPANARSLLSVPGVRDCRIQDDGRIVVLTDLPTPRIIAFADAWSEPELVGELEQESAALLDHPDGSITTIPDGVRGALYLNDGRLMTVGNDWNVMAGGAIVSELGSPLMGITSGLDRPAFAKMVQRPDGLVVLVAFGAEKSNFLITTLPWAIDPNTGERWPLSDRPIDAVRGIGLAVVPGGNWADPWRTGHGWPGTESAPPPDQGPDIDDPYEPKGGEPITTTETTNPGCTAAPTGTPWPVALLLLLALPLYRRQRA